MVVLGLEKDDGGIRNGGTLAFADRTGLEIVVDDSAHDALHQFFSPNRGEGTNNSDFVILNGVPNSPSHDLWEVVYTRSRTLSVSEIRGAIDSIEAGEAVPELPPAEPPVLSDAAADGAMFSFSVSGTAGYRGVVEFSVDGSEWQMLRELDFGDTPVSIVDPISGDQAHRLYRVRNLAD